MSKQRISPHRKEPPMQKPIKRLGRGLSSLISVPETIEEPTSVVGESTRAPGPSLLPANQISPNPFQPRKEIAPEGLKSLATSIEKTGLIQPIVVRQKGPQLYELIAGERRWRASQMAGLTE